MILVKNKWFPFGNYKAINICGIVFYKGDNLSDKTIKININSYYVDNSTSTPAA